MLRSSYALLKSCKYMMKPICCAFSTSHTTDDSSFKKLLLETVLNEKHFDQYDTIVSASGSSLIDGFLETIDKVKDRLLVVSNGYTGDCIAKKAFEMGIPTDWCFHSMLFPMDTIEAAEDVVNRPRITHALFVHVDSFTGSITPLNSILQKVRKVRTDVTICVDNRDAYHLHPMSSISSIIDYSIHDTSILHIQPSFGFCVCHKPAIMVQSHKHPQSLFGSLYNHSMCLDKMKPSVSEVYSTELAKQSWTTQSYQFEETKARLVNKVKHLLPFVLGDVDQSCVAASFLAPQELVRLRELLESLKELNIPVSYHFLTPSLPMISFKTEDLIEYEAGGGEIMNIYKCIDKVVRKKQGGFEPDKDLLKQELEYRKKFIYGK